MFVNARKWKAQTAYEQHKRPPTSPLPLPLWVFLRKLSPFQALSWLPLSLGIFALAHSVDCLSTCPFLARLLFELFLPPFATLQLLFNITIFVSHNPPFALSVNRLFPPSLAWSVHSVCIPQALDPATLPWHQPLPTSYIVIRGTLRSLFGPKSALQVPIHSALRSIDSPPPSPAFALA